MRPVWFLAWAGQVSSGHKRPWGSSDELGVPALVGENDLQREGEAQPALAPDRRLRWALGVRPGAGRGVPSEGDLALEGPEGHLEAGCVEHAPLLLQPQPG